MAPCGLMLNKGCSLRLGVFYSGNNKIIGEDWIMARAWDLISGKTAAASKPRDWRKRMSDNIAYALLVYTGLQIFITMGSLEGKGGSLLPYFALVILVAAIIPACRNFEKRWNRLSDSQATDPQFAPWFRRDLIGLWTIAIGLPFVVTALFKGLALTFG